MTLSDPYLIPGTDVLRNKFGILESSQLDQLVDDIAIVEAVVLFHQGVRVKPTLVGWRAVHKAMFGAAFDWAGELRIIHIRKLDERGLPSGFFAPFDRIEADAKQPMRHLEAILRRAAIDDSVRMADNLAEVYAHLNFLHPFREGNGRSQKVFFSAVCKAVGIELDWSAFPAEEHNAAASRAMNGDLRLLKEHFRAILKKSGDPRIRLRSNR